MYNRLRIGGVEVDLPERGLDINLVYEVSDGGIVTAARAKRYIELPATKTNLQVFGFWDNISAFNQSAQELKPFRYEAAGVTLLTGQAQLQSGDLAAGPYGFRGRNLKVGLYGTNADWTLRIKDLKLRDLDFTDAIYNTAQVLSGWIADYNSGDFFGFTLVKLKEWSIAGQVDIDEFTPFIFIRSILDKIFSSIGYTIQSDFLNSNVFKKLILLTPLPQRYPTEFSQDYINTVAELPQTAAIPGAYPIFILPNQTTTPPLGNPYNSGTGVYTVPFTGYYEINLRVSVRNVVTFATAALAMEVNGIFASITPTPNISFTGITTNQDFNFTSNVLFLNAGDTLTLNQVINVGSNYEHYIQVSIIGEAEVSFGSLLAWKYLLSDWKAVDFVNGLQQMFNLRFEADPVLQTIRIEPADDYLYRERNTFTTGISELRTGFYLDSQTDNLSKIDLVQENILYNETETAEITELKYITDGETEEFFEENEPLGYYTARYVQPPSRFTPAIFERENVFFAKTIHTIDNQIRATTTQVNIQVPLIYKQNYQLDPTATEAPTEIQPRILFFAGVRLAGFFAGWDGKINCAFSPGVPLGWPRAFMVNYQNSLDVSLSYANETVNGVEVPGLLRCFWLQDFARKRIGKRLEAYYFWKRLDILELSFRNKIRLESRNYVLQKIDGFKPLKDSSTKTILLLDQRPEQEDVDAVISSDLTGIVNPV